MDIFTRNTHTKNNIFSTIEVIKQTTKYTLDKKSLSDL